MPSPAPQLNADDEDITAEPDGTFTVTFPWSFRAVPVIKGIASLEQARLIVSALWAAHCEGAADATVD